MSKVAIIGGGPAGMLAAATAAGNGHAVTLFEKNEKLGKKLYLTGKGRCNVTNSADMDELMANIPCNPKFLYSALYGFSNNDIVALLERMGVPTKVERGGRVFPQSDKSSDVIKALETYVKRNGVNIRLNCAVCGIKTEADGRFLLKFASNRVEHFDALVLCTGGCSYQSTGSNGDGYDLAHSLGHSVTDIHPSLIPLETIEDWPRELMGLSLKNVVLKVYRRKKVIYSELGEMLFTHFGVSGPLVLSASSRIADAPEGVHMEIDLKPGLTAEELDRRLLRDFDKNTRRIFANSLAELLPSKLIPVIIELSNIRADTPINEITRQQRLDFGMLLKCLPFTVKQALPVDEAIVTRGGIPVKEIDASTMQSKLVKNLFFAGELIDVDGYTGGFNLQIAYSTGALAGNSIK
ncbi:MAG: NAD(P)/FAD-dependent oxidoreductase [Clostridia bacterium]